MTTRSKGPSAGFGWLTNGFSVGFRHPKSLFGGAAFLIVASLLPSLVTMPIQFHAISTGTPLSPATFGWLTGGSMLLSLLLVPLYAGYLQVIDAAERGLPARALGIFKPYQQGEALRLIGYGLAMIMVYIALFGIVIAATGGGIASWYMQVLTAQANHQPPPTALPDGFGITMALFMLLVLFMMAFYAISLGQVALRHRSVFGAIGDGLIGALKNLLPLLVFAVSSILVWIVVAIGIAIVALLLGLLAKLVSWLVLLVVIPLYIALLLLMFTMMYGVMYQLWRDVCGVDIVTGVAPALAA